MAIVTGAGSTPGPGVGTGRASAVVLAREGVRAVRRPGAGAGRGDESLIESEGGTAEVLAADCTRSADCEAMVQAAVDAFGGLDVLVNNIGRAFVGTVVDTSEEDWDRALDLNLRTAFRPQARRAARDGRGRRRVDREHLVDLGHPGRRDDRLLGGQGALLAMTVDAASHGRQGDPRSTPSPPATSTPMVHSVQQPGPQAEFMDTMRREANLLGTPGDGWDVGWAVGFLASDEARWITGRCCPSRAGCSA